MSRLTSYPSKDLQTGNFQQRSQLGPGCPKGQNDCFTAYSLFLLKGSSNRDIDIGVDIDVDMDMDPYTAVSICCGSFQGSWGSFKGAWG